MADDRLEHIRAQIEINTKLDRRYVLLSLDDAKFLLANIKCCAGHRHKCDKCSNVDERDAETILFCDLREMVLDKSMELCLGEDAARHAKDAIRRGDTITNATPEEFKAFWIRIAKHEMGITYKVGLGDE